MWYGSRNNDFLDRCDVDLDLSRLRGWGNFVFHLTPKAYSVIIARTLLKYLTLLSGSEYEQNEAIASNELSAFLAFFSVAPDGDFLVEALRLFNSDEVIVLKNSTQAIREMEMIAFNRDESYLDEVDDFIAWLNI